MNVLLYNLGEIKLDGAKLKDAGIRFTTKPGSWDDIQAIGIETVERILEKTVKEVPAWEIFSQGFRPKYPLATIENRPADEIVIIKFSTGERYLINTNGASTYIRWWLRLI